MNAEDTVTYYKCHCEYNLRSCHCYCDDCASIRGRNKELLKQAQISFKTGQKDLANKIDDWFEFNMPMLHEQLKHSINWQNKLKEWGINNEE
jgi:hypothetical protein